MACVLLPRIDFHTVSQGVVNGSDDVMTSIYENLKLKYE